MRRVQKPDVSSFGSHELLALCQINVYEDQKSKASLLWLGHPRLILWQILFVTAVRV